MAVDDFLKLVEGLLIGLNVDVAHSLSEELKTIGVLFDEDVTDAIIEIIESVGKWYFHLPASEANHHCYPFGLFVHSIDTAYRAAKIARADGLSGLDLIEIFLAGLLHDAGKIFDVERVGDVPWLSDHPEPLEYFVRKVLGWKIPPLPPIKLRVGRKDSHKENTLPALAHLFCTFPEESCRILEATDRLGLCIRGLNGLIATATESLYVVTADAASAREDISLHIPMTRDEMLNLINPKSVLRLFSDALKKGVDTGKLRFNVPGSYLWSYGHYVYLVYPQGLRWIMNRWLPRKDIDIWPSDTPAAKRRRFLDMCVKNRFCPCGDGKAVKKARIYYSPSNWTAELNVVAFRRELIYSPPTDLEGFVEILEATK